MVGLSSATRVCPGEEARGRGLRGGAVVGVDMGVDQRFAAAAERHEGEVAGGQVVDARVIGEDAGEDEAIRQPLLDDAPRCVEAFRDVAHGVDGDAVGRSVQRLAESIEDLRVFHAVPLIVGGGGDGHQHGGLVGLAGAQREAAGIRLVAGLFGGLEDLLAGLGSDHGRTAQRL